MSCEGRHVTTDVTSIRTTSESFTKPPLNWCVARLRRVSTAVIGPCVMNFHDPKSYGHVQASCRAYISSVMLSRSLSRVVRQRWGIGPPNRNCCSLGLFRVCLFVCPLARITRKPHGRTSPYFVHVAYGRSSALLWRRCDTLCTSGFVDDGAYWPESGTTWSLDVRQVALPVGRQDN